MNLSTQREEHLLQAQRIKTTIKWSEQSREMKKTIKRLVMYVCYTFQTDELDISDSEVILVNLTAEINH